MLKQQDTRQTATATGNANYPTDHKETQHISKGDTLIGLSHQPFKDPKSYTLPDKH